MKAIFQLVVLGLVPGIDEETFDGDIVKYDDPIVVVAIRDERESYPLKKRMI